VCSIKDEIRYSSKKTQPTTLDKEVSKKMCTDIYTLVSPLSLHVFL